jgi:hypothetical protein
MYGRGNSDSFKIMGFVACLVAFVQFVQEGKENR